LRLRGYRHRPHRRAESYFRAYYCAYQPAGAIGRRLHRGRPIEFDADGETLLGYLSRPTLPGPHPAIVIVHENRGLLPHFHDVTRRYAREGYVALAIDMLSRQGGADAFADGNEMRVALGRIPQDQVVYDGNAAVKYLQSLPYVRNDRVGATGFCFGGSIVWQMAVGNPELRAAVPFYGSAPSLDDVAGMQVPVLGIYAGEDSRINAGVPALEAAMIAQNKEHKFITYPGANHAFFNDTGSRYHPQAAEAAWMEALDWFEDHLMDS
jgi:carboxymethylenebutenolidase